MFSNFTCAAITFMSFCNCMAFLEGASEGGPRYAEFVTCGIDGGGMHISVDSSGTGSGGGGGAPKLI